MKYNNYLGCHYLERFNLVLMGLMDGERFVTLCVEPFYRDDVPGVPLGDSAKETLGNLIKLRNNIISEMMNDIADSQRVYTKGSTKCMLRSRDNWRENNLIEVVIIGMYPAPCQSKCPHCIFINDIIYHGGLTDETRENYEKALDLIEYAVSNGYIREDALWQLSSGEIAIHPYKDRILKLVGDNSCLFLTNCMKYDKGIAKNLAANPKSRICLTIDAGTPETHIIVKCVDNFDSVIETLYKYKRDSRPGQIDLRYIIFPGVNDSVGNFEGILSIMRDLEINKLSLLRDSRKKYNTPQGEMEKVIKALAKWAALLEKNGMTCNFFYMYPEQEEQIVAMAKELIASGKV